jgi:hypothetical protein
VHGAKDSVDPGRDAVFPYGADSLPKTFITDRNGIVVQVPLRKLRETDLRDAISKLQ